ncbi:unnamed protein product [Bursaphelenchus xylophilus]|nr:unnamed protein product [Bursaphelenchus xylophilus]CAG9122985.1 unnamed protein product [Bursaphelenchus xylophilus]
MTDSKNVPSDPPTDPVSACVKEGIQTPEEVPAPDFIEVSDSFLLFLRYTKAVSERVWLVIGCFIGLIVIFALTQGSDDPKLRWISRAILLFLIALIAASLSVPLILLSPRSTRYIVFQNFIRKPPVHFEDVAKFGVRSMARNFYISSPCPHSATSPILGLWHILPEALNEKFKKLGVKTAEMFEFADDSYPVVVYYHGTNEHRAKTHRCMTYNFLSDMNFHVIVGDYRGYGDSTGFVTEKGVIRDAINIYLYVHEKCNQNPKKKIVVWGHSLGTGISCMFVNQLNKMNLKPYSLILESPFSALHDVFLSQKILKIFLWIPYFREYLAFCLQYADISMDNHKHITDIQCPILMLHANDDPVVPIELGKKLFDHVKHANNLVEIKTFDAKLQLRHNHMYRAPDLTQVIRDFLQKVDQNQV